jgi:hypothetical protein
MTIQIQQTFPHCERCGIMIHTRRERIVARTLDGREITLCSELCRDEYLDLYGLGERGGQTSSAPRRRPNPRTHGS